MNFILYAICAVILCEWIVICVFKRRRFAVGDKVMIKCLRNEDGIIEIETGSQSQVLGVITSVREKGVPLWCGCDLSWNDTIASNFDYVIERNGNHTFVCDSDVERVNQ